MNTIIKYAPELIFLLLLFANSLFLKKHNYGKRSIIVMNTIFVSASLLCVGLISWQMLQQSTIHLFLIFKIYFIMAGIYYIFMYSYRFHALERLTITSLCIGLFLMISNPDPFVFFMSFAICTASIYGLTLSRERPVKDAITMSSIMVIIAITYNLNAFFASFVILVFLILFLLRTTSKDLEVISVTFLVPAILFVIFRTLASANDKYIIQGPLTITGLTLMLSSSVLLLSKFSNSKNMAKFFLFYLGSIIFMLGSGSQDARAIAILMILLLTFTYIPSSNPLTILSLSMAPMIGSFIAKIPLFFTPLQTELLIQMLIIGTTCVSTAVFTGIELYRSYRQIKNENELSPMPIILKIVSIAVIIVSVVYLDSAIRILGK